MTAAVAAMLGLAGGTAQAGTGQAAPSFVPPYVFEAIAKNGTPAQRQEALRQLQQDRSLLPGGEGQLAPQARRALLPRGIYNAFNTTILPGVLVWRGPPAPLPADAATGKYHTWEKPGSTDGKTLSAFGQFTWDITSQLELAGGVRYTEEEKDSWLTNSWVHPPLSGTVLAPEGKMFTDKFKDDNLSPEATLTWRPTEDLTAYVGYRTGYKSGGFGISTNLTPANITVDSIRFDSEEIEGFEGGVKARLLDGRLVITGDVYTYDYTDLQVTSFNPATTSFIISNAASATIKGAEIGLTAKPLDWLTVNAGIAYNEARFDDYLAQFWKQVLPNLTLNPQAVLRKGRRLAAAFRKNSPVMARTIAAFTEKRPPRWTGR